MRSSVWAILAAAALLVGSALGSAASASVVMDGTRVILNEKPGEVSVNLTSRNSLPVLVQIWIDKGDPDARPDQVEVPFTLAPPLFRMNPDQKQTIRILALGDDNALPTDRESVFYLNVMEIPPKPDSAEFRDKNVLQFAIRSRLKLFYRPAGISGNPDAAPTKLQWHLQAVEGKTRLHVDNPTAYHVTVAAINFKGGLSGHPSPPPFMIGPFGSLDIDAPVETQASGGHVEFTYSFVDDFGAFRQFAARL